jgi:hypothetical protein
VQRDPAHDGYHGTDDKERSNRSVPTERDHPNDGHDGSDDEDASHSGAKLRERHAHSHFVVGRQWPALVRLRRYDDLHGEARSGRRN